MGSVAGKYRIIQKGSCFYAEKRVALFFWVRLLCVQSAEDVYMLLLSPFLAPVEFPTFDSAKAAIDADRTPVAPKVLLASYP